jgi:hypothetical protein
MLTKKNAKLLELEPNGWGFTRPEIEALYSVYGFVLPSNVAELITEVLLPACLLLE